MVGIPDGVVVEIILLYDRLDLLACLVADLVADLLVCPDVIVRVSSPFLVARGRYESLMSMLMLMD